MDLSKNNHSSTFSLDAAQIDLKIIETIVKQLVGPNLVLFNATKKESFISQAEETIAGFFLSSEMTHIEAFFEVINTIFPHPLIKSRMLKLESTFRQWGPLIARSGSRQFQGGISAMYKLEKGRNEFLAKQQAFGESAYEEVKRATAQLKQNQSTLLSIFQQFAKWRAGIALKRNDKFLAQECQNFRNSETMFQMKSCTPIGYFLGNFRYAAFVPMIETYYDAACQSKVDKTLLINGERGERGYQLIYQLKGSNKVVKMTQMRYSVVRSNFNNSRLFDSGWYWQHTKPKHLDVLWKDLESLHTEILNLKVDLTKPEDIQMLNQKIAAGYWLGSNIMITARGNAQYMLMVMATWYRYHGLTPPIPSLEASQPDCIAISTPYHLFIENFMALFNSPPEVLSAE